MENLPLELRKQLYSVLPELIPLETVEHAVTGSTERDIEEFSQVAEFTNYVDLTTYNQDMRYIASEEENNRCFLEEMTDLFRERPNIIDEVIPEDIPDNYSRFKGADWFEIVQGQRILLAGLGGIGSWTALLLSRLGIVSIDLFDDDRFEGHNMSGQFVSKNDINRNKAEVSVSHLNNFSNYHRCNTYVEKYDASCFTRKIMICGFDNMEARRVFYNRWKADIDEKIAHEYLFIDGRLLAEEWQIICITGDRVDQQEVYEREYLFDDLEVEEADCTMKQTSHVAAMIASNMVSYFINFCNNLSEDNIPRRLPFFSYYNSPSNIYEFKY